LRAFLSYRRSKQALCFWRSTHPYEVDFVIGNKVAIEVKSTTHTTSRHLMGLKALAEEGIFEDFYLISQAPVERVIPIAGGAKARIIPWKSFLEALWSAMVVS